MAGGGGEQTNDHGLVLQTLKLPVHIKTLMTMA